MSAHPFPLLAAHIGVGRLGEFRPSPEADSKKFNVKVDRRPYTGTKYTLEKMAAYVKDGSVSPSMRQFAEMVVRNSGAAPSEKLSHRRAASILLGYVKDNARYRPDPNNVEMVQDPHITLCVPGALMCIPVEDCFPEGTLLLKDDFSFVPVEKIKVGDRIWGKDKWTRVEATKLKGKLSVDAVEMNNGSTMCLTPDHKIYVGSCKHERAQCPTCFPANRKVKFDRVAVSDLQDGDVLLQPERIEFGEGVVATNRMYVEALALADGWVRDNCRTFYIAGKDGHRKEKQKHEVKAICEKLGIETLWYKRYIGVHDPDWAERIAKLGSRARFKHLETLNLDETSAKEALRGLMADSTPSSVKDPEGSRTFSTTSHELMLQVRVLHRMFGISTSVKMLTPEQHGGAGKHPLWRVANRSSATGRREKTLTVKSIERSVKKVMCWDIQTEDHYVYLPEHDVTVSNCDGLTVALGSLMGAYGIPVRIMKQTFNDDDSEEHVLIIFQTDEGTWLAADPSAPASAGVGFKASASKEVIIDPLDPGGTGTQASEFVGIGKIRIMIGTVRDEVVATQTRLEDLALATAISVSTCQRSGGAIDDAAWTNLSQRILTYVSADPDTVQVSDGEALATELYGWGDKLQAAGCQRPIPAPIPGQAPAPTPMQGPDWPSAIKWGLGAVMVVGGAYALKQVVDLVKIEKHIAPAAFEARRLVRRRRRRRSA